MIATCPSPNFQTRNLLRGSSFAFTKSQAVHFGHRASSRAVHYQQWGQRSGPRLMSSLQPEVQERGRFDPELRSVLELATDTELSELASILFGRSYFSPLLKSLIGGSSGHDVLHEEASEVRDDFIQLIESHFLFLAADARQTLRGWRPSYRDVLLDLRKKLKVPCSSKLKTGDLEAEIFLHLLQEYSRMMVVTEDELQSPWLPMVSLQHKVKGAESIITIDRLLMEVKGRPVADP